MDLYYPYIRLWQTHRNSQKTSAAIVSVMYLLIWIIEAKVQFWFIFWFMGKVSYSLNGREGLSLGASPGSTAGSQSLLQDFWFCNFKKLVAWEWCKGKCRVNLCEGESRSKRGGRARP